MGTKMENAMLAAFNNTMVIDNIITLNWLNRSGIFPKYHLDILGLSKMDRWMPPFEGTQKKVFLGVFRS